VEAGASPQHLDFKNSRGLRVRSLFSEIYPSEAAFARVGEPPFRPGLYKHDRRHVSVSSEAIALKGS
jgi:hypothetical protein